MSEWGKIGFEIETTGDGSLSLYLIQKNVDYREHGETMHHSAGAVSETQLIYGTVIQRCFSLISKPHFLVIGLGLGYIELNIVKELLMQGKGSADLGQIISYESVPELRNYFLMWIRRELLPPEIQNTYDSVLQATLKDSGLSEDLFRKTLYDIYTSNKGHVREALNIDTQISEKFHCVLYDAFSFKTTPYLWEEDFLISFLNQVSTPDFIFSTYACRSSLKKALSEAGIKPIIQAGFKGKRKTIQGQKGLFLKE